MKAHKLTSEKRAGIIFSLIGFLFFFFCISEYLLARQGNLNWNAGFVCGILLASLGFGTAAGCMSAYCLYRYEKRKAGKLSHSKWSSERLPGAGVCFFTAWLLIFLAWFPGYLAYYPAICSYDITIQTGQVVAHAYNDHHPILHTLLIGMFMDLGNSVFGDINTGIAVFAALQMLLLSGSLAAGIGFLRAGKKKWPWLAALLLYGMLFPFHTYMSVSITKDTVFSALFLLQVFILLHILEKGENRFRPGGFEILYFILTVGMILFRNNGSYAFLVLLFCNAAALVFGKQRRKLYGRLLLNGMAGFLAGSFILSGLFNAVGAVQGDKREMLSMPIQQLARCMVYHGGAGVEEQDDNSISEEDKALVNEFILNQAYKNYRPDIADPVKRNTNTYVVRYRTKEFITTYFRLLGRYPGDFINAALAVNAGYLSPFDTGHAYINVNELESGMGYIQTRWVEAELNPRGIYKDSKWEWLHGVLEEFADKNAYLNVPLLKYIFVPGSYLWLCLILAGYLLWRKKYHLLLPMMLVFGYYATLFLGPTVQLRYLYPVMIAVPFLGVWLLTAPGPDWGRAGKA